MNTIFRASHPGDWPGGHHVARGTDLGGDCGC